MSERDHEITVLNPMYLPHWIDVKSEVSEGDRVVHKESIRKLKLTSACSNCTLVSLCRSLGVHVTKFRAANGRVIIEVVSTKKSYGSFLKQMTKRYKFDVFSARAALPDKPGSGLTPRRLKAVQLAFTQGYYDFPRRVSLATLALQIGCAPSTLDETLRRGEKVMLQGLLNAQESLLLPAVSLNQPFAHSSNPKDDALVTQVFGFDMRIRLCMIIGNDGKRIAGGMRRGVESLEPDSETIRLQRDEVITRRMDEAWNKYFGRTDFTMEHREKILIINFYLPDSSTIVVTAERDFPVQKMRQLCDIVDGFQVEAPNQIST
jgi:DNA binding protein with HTH domain